MSTITKIGDGNLIQRTKNAWSNFKIKYCPNGQTCDDLASVSALLFMFWFMYVAMKPILVF